MKKLLILFIIILLPIYILLKIDQKYVFTGDGLNKLIQSESLLKNNFLSEELFYPARDLDPNFNAYPFQGPYLIKKNERHIGQYPVFFSFFSALLLKVIPYYWLPGIFFIFAIATLFMLYKFWAADLKSLVFVSLCTNFFLYGIDFSENLLLIFIHFVSLTLLFSNDKSIYKITKLFFAGFFLGCAVWLRLEALLFFISLIFSWIFMGEFNKNIIQSDKKYFIFGFLLVLFSFFIFNYFDYSNILGPRFIANKADFFSNSFSDKFSQVLHISFGGKYKLGFFGYTPLFLIIFIAPFFSFYKNLSVKIKTLTITLIIFIVMVLISAPNDGVVSWGSRYLSLAIFPSAIVLNEIINKIQFQKKNSKIIFYSLVIFLSFYSFLITLVGFAFLKNANKQLKEYHNEFISYKDDIKILGNPFMFTMIGVEYFHSIYLIPRNSSSLIEIISVLKNKTKGKRIIFFESLPRSIDNTVITDLNLNENSDFAKILDDNLIKDKIMKGKYTRASIYKIK